MPLDPKLQKFTTARQTLVSVDWTDFADGTGNVTFNLTNYIEDTTADYYLHQTALASNTIAPQADNNTATFTKNLDLDFDLTPFNFAKTLKGISRGNITLGARTLSAAPNTWEVYAIIKLRHWDGSTETEIAQSQTETLAGGGGAINVKESKVMGFSIDATAGQNFAVGDTLRVTVEIWGREIAGNSYGGFGCDPADRNDESAVNGGIIEDTDSTQAIITIPFETDL